MESKSARLDERTFSDIVYSSDSKTGTVQKQPFCSRTEGKDEIKEEELSKGFLTDFNSDEKGYNTGRIIVESERQDTSSKSPLAMTKGAAKGLEGGPSAYSNGEARAGTATQETKGNESPISLRRENSQHLE